MAKPRQKAMRVAYIKKRFGSEMINGGERINTALRKEFQQFSFNPSVPLPNRRMLRKNDPSRPEPKITDFITNDGKIDQHKFEMAVLDWQKRKDNPTLTTPMVEKLLKHNPGHFGLQPKKIEPYTQIWIDAGNYILKAVFNKLDDSAIYFFIEIDKTLNRVRRSRTMSKRTALALRENGLKGIPWKE